MGGMGARGREGDGKGREGKGRGGAGCGQTDGNGMGLWRGGFWEDERMRGWVDWEEVVPDGEDGG